MKFEVGPGVECDLDVLVTTRALVQANSGGGKSWALRRLLEQTFGHVQHLVIDPEGEFASLREKYDYVLAAREGGDTVADPRFAKLLAERLLELGVSAVIDIYELKAHERVRFVKLFLDALVNAPKRLYHPALVVLDEAHVYCPQTGSAESGPSVIDLCTRGRKRGYCAVLATQRLAKLHKDAAAECNNKLIGRCLEVDAKRAADELGFTGRDGWHQFRELEAGEFYAVGPALTRSVKRVHVGGVLTTHPEAGQRVGLTAPPPTAAVRALLPKLEDLPKEAEEREHTAETLRRDLATTRRELTLARKEAPAPVADEKATERAVAAALHTRDREHAAALKAAQGQGDRLERVIGKAVTGMERMTAEMRAALNGAAPAPEMPRAVPPPARYEPEAKALVRVPRSLPPDGDALSAAQQRILDTLADLEALGVEQPTKSVVAVFAGVSPTSGGYFTNLGRLRSFGLLEYPAGGTVVLTEAGREQAAPPNDIASVAALHEAWCRQVSGAQAAILRELIALHPDDIGKDELAERLDVSPTSGGYFNNLGRLRSLGAIDYPKPGRAVATELLFPRGLA